MVNNKIIGTQFERDVCKILSDHGYWVHFIAPDSRGAQPFDIIACKDNEPMVADCKTCVNHIFSIDRLENNQVFAFEKWYRCGNSMPVIFVKHKENIYKLYYSELVIERKVDLNEKEPWYEY